MPNVFEMKWLAKTLARGNRLLVPPASKLRQKCWNGPRIPVWETPVASTKNDDPAPWWLLQKGQVLDVLARPQKHGDRIWVHVAFQNGECNGWILADHAHSCLRYRSLKSTPLPTKKPTQARVSDLRSGVVFEYHHAMAIVVSWTTTTLPRPEEMALVTIEHEGTIKKVWLSQLQVP